MARIDSEQRRKILEAAIHVFSLKGLEGTSIRQVGIEAGVNSALMYYYFENKERLFEEAIRVVVHGLLDRMQERLRPFADGKDRVGFLGGQRVRVLFRLSRAPPADGDCQHPVSEVIGKTIPSILKERVLLPMVILQEGIAKGEIKPMHPIQYWWSILGVCLFRIFMKKIISHMDSKMMKTGFCPMGDDRDQIKQLMIEGVVIPAKTEPISKKESQ